MSKGIDVSEHNGKIDWAKIKTSGIEFAIIRAGYGDDISQKDSEFDNNVQGALANGIKVGIYYFSYAVDCNDAVAEARVCKEIITKYSGKIEYPVYFDFEYDSIRYFTKQKGIAPDNKTITDMTIAFCDEMRRGCWKSGIYTNIDFWKNKYDTSRLGNYEIWLADYNGGTPAYPCGLRQTASDGQVDGNGSSNMDIDESLKDYPTIIKSENLNGLKATVTPAPAPAPVVAPAAPAPAINITTSTYTVKSGDTLSGIAARYGTTYQILAQINGISNPNLINVGQVLKIHSVNASIPSAPSYSTYTVKSGDSLWGIASSQLGNGSRYNEIKRLNGLSSDTIYPGNVLKIPK